ncbi:ATP-dependent protease subunit HslV [Pediococcus claussenii]|uniref:ATP-dependent protease HslVU, peptidase subunit n=1 Tax=Pediococcus claussenii (strain ATCC BAA-344 / DSM 14800 / JCM 18046 / KCTC 3811 / LMG 21948 / P06) TaxID=701521 RepID=G8PD61_PEDCP|nr:ATP-dependent protease subunit HslV [Pediococcus claussenii]AEV95196.1 ATP-dependent protease HslVU, peptidase subunit [Pediococcus claussenii ATCC BAA-344]ANZ70427.1 ATP-dependent protease subunit HslV [Pediococcus claussenii]ANZ72243.1 ATP-dependent protease subunit HslV [Pediococcus claussenii]KRN19621.1 hslV protein [Pediococcus claussenii]
MPVQFEATTIIAINHNGENAMAGDGQVTMGEKFIMKGTARKVRRIYEGKVLVGFAGSVADAFNLEEKFEKKLSEYSGNLQRASVELAKIWRGDQQLQKLEAMLIVMDKHEMYLVSGSGEVIAPDDGILAIGSGGNFALSAAKAMKAHAKNMTAKEMATAAINVAGDIDIFTNHNVIAMDFNEED